MEVCTRSMASTHTEILTVKQMMLQKLKFMKQLLKVHNFESGYLNVKASLGLNIEKNLLKL